MRQRSGRTDNVDYEDDENEDGAAAAATELSVCSVFTSSFCCLSTHADGQGVDISVTVCNFACLLRLQISPPRIETSGVKFCTAVHRRPGHRMSQFGELCSPEAQNRTNQPARGGR